MKKHQKWMIWVLAMILIFLLVLFLGQFMYKKYEEGILRKEMNQIMKLDITKDTIPMNIKSHGTYQVVEKAMKKYFSSYAESTKKTLSILNDTKLSGLLSADTVNEDGPSFTNTKTYIQTTRENLENYMGTMITMSSDKAILEEIQKTKVSKYYENLYRDLMLDSSVSDSLKNEQTSLIESKNKMLSLLDTYDEIFNFLIQNEGNYQIQNGKLLFKNNALLSQYTHYVEQLK